jgi:hypothetical protein
VNYEVYCLSADTPTIQSKWQTKVDYGLFSDDLSLELKIVPRWCYRRNFLTPFFQTQTVHSSERWVRLTAPKLNEVILFLARGANFWTRKCQSNQLTGTLLLLASRVISEVHMRCSPKLALEFIKGLGES